MFLHRIGAIILAFGCFLLLSVNAQAKPEADVSANSEVNDVFSAELSASQKAIATIEPRPFSKAGRGELSLGMGTIASDIFILYLPITLRGAYHFKEWVSLELAASFMGCFSGEVGDNLARGGSQKCMRAFTPTYDRLSETSSDTQLRGVIVKEYQVARFDLNPVFSLFMGKFSLMNQSIIHYDLNLTAGLGVLIVEMPDSIHIGKINYGASAEGNLGLGLRFVFRNFVGVRFDFREYLFGKQNDKGLGTSSEFALSVSFLL